MLLHTYIKLTWSFARGCVLRTHPRSSNVNQVMMKKCFIISLFTFFFIASTHHYQVPYVIIGLVIYIRESLLIIHIKKITRRKIYLQYHALHGLQTSHFFNFRILRILILLIIEWHEILIRSWPLRWIYNTFHVFAVRTRERNVAAADVRTGASWSV